MVDRGIDESFIEMTFRKKTSLVETMRVVLFDDDLCSQAKEGMWGMPGHTEAMKAVVSCEKLRGVAHTR
jgi:hypothetical protein